MQQMIALRHSLDEAMMQYTAPEQAPHAHVGRPEHATAPEVWAGRLQDGNSAFQQPLPPQNPMAATGGMGECPPGARLSRSFSSASRNPHRLSLTLPIAPPTPNPSRPAPSSVAPSSTAPSYPPTPSVTPSAVTLSVAVDPNEFITAIAAQERRVLELREEWQSAEVELRRLKKQWTVHQAHKKRAERRNVEPLSPMNASDSGGLHHHPHRHIATMADPSDEEPRRHSLHSDLDRRKAWLLSQQQQEHQQQVGERGKRRIFSGGHARTLSLLSPTKPSPSGFSVHEDTPSETNEIGNRSSNNHELLHSPRLASRYAPISPALLAKRASWAPRSSHRVSASTSGLRQITDDLRSGLWTFVEDLRQATVGEEPITGSRQHLRSIDGNVRSGGDSSGYKGMAASTPASATTAKSVAVADTSGQETIRASGVGAVSRPRGTLAGVFDGTPTPASRFMDAPSHAISGTADSEAAVVVATKPKAKRFSWMPLTLDNLDDADWSSWDSPSVSSPRWSSSTVAGDIIPVPEKVVVDEAKASAGDENTTLPKSPSSSSKSSQLENMIPPMLKELSPTNLKWFTKDWERSLVDPAPATPAESSQLA